MTKKYFLAIGCVITFLCTAPNLFAQIGFEAPVKTESIDFPCTKNGIPDGISFRMQAGTSPIGPSFNVVDINQTTDVIVAFPGNTITTFVTLVDQDKKCAGIGTGEVFGKGPYRIEVDIIGDAIFAGNQTNSFQ